MASTGIRGSIQALRELPDNPVAVLLTRQARYSPDARRGSKRVKLQLMQSMLNKGSRRLAGNRTRFHRNVASGYTSSYGKARYSFHLTQGFAGLTLRRVHAPPGRVGVAGGWKLHRAEGPTLVLALSADRRALSETADHISANMNLTEIDESYNNSGNINHLYTYFDVDDLNRVSSHRTKVICQLTPGLAGLALRRVQAPPGRAEEHRSPNFHVVRTSAAPRRQPDTRFGLSGRPASPWMSGQKNRDRSRMLQNYDGSSTYGDEWRWAGTQNSHSSPLKSPNADTASQTAYNIANDKTPQRRSFLSPTSEGDQRNLYGQGKPQAKDSTGGGASWYVGVTSQPQTAQMANVESRLFFEGTVTATDMSRATDTREKGRIGITGSAQAYAGSNGRVTSEAIGRDINPLGRGSGAALVGGMMNVGTLAPSLPGGKREVNQGNSVNNESDYPEFDVEGKCKDEFDDCFSKYWQYDQLWVSFCEKDKWIYLSNDVNLQLDPNESQGPRCSEDEIIQYYEERLKRCFKSVEDEVYPWLEEACKDTKEFCLTDFVQNCREVWARCKVVDGSYKKLVDCLNAHCAGLKDREWRNCIARVGKNECKNQRNAYMEAKKVYAEWQRIMQSQMESCDYWINEIAHIDWYLNSEFSECIRDVLRAARKDHKCHFIYDDPRIEIEVIDLDQNETEHLIYRENKPCKKCQ